jgi:hypothetical protein
VTVYSSSPDLSLADAPGPTTLMTMARTLLDITESCALALGVALPERRVTYMAPMPADCPQVAVLIGGWQLEPPAEGLFTCDRGRWVAQLGVVITRKTPAVPSAAGDLPKPSQLEQAAQIASDDAEVLLQVVASMAELADVLVETPAAEGGLQSATLAFRAPAFGAF